MMDAAEREALRALAKAAVCGAPEDRHRWTAEWEPYFTSHGDPSVIESGRGLFGIVATVSTAPEDYGRARAEWIAAADPQTVLALLDALDAAEERERQTQRALTALGVALGALWESAGHGDTIEAEMAHHAIERVNIALGITLAPSAEVVDQ